MRKISLSLPDRAAILWLSSSSMLPSPNSNGLHFSSHVRSLRRGSMRDCSIFVKSLLQRKTVSYKSSSKSFTQRMSLIDLETKRSRYDFNASPTSRFSSIRTILDFPDFIRVPFFYIYGPATLSCHKRQQRPPEFSKQGNRNVGWTDPQRKYIPPYLPSPTVFCDQRRFLLIPCILGRPTSRRLSKASLAHGPLSVFNK